MFCHQAMDVKLPPLAALLPPEILNCSSSTSTSSAFRPAFASNINWMNKSSYAKPGVYPTPVLDSFWSAPSFSGRSTLSCSKTEPIKTRVDPFDALIKAASLISEDRATDNGREMTHKAVLARSPDLTSADESTLSSPPLSSPSCSPSPMSDNQIFFCTLERCCLPFKSASELHHHQQVSHFAPRPFVCDHPDCSKSFTQSSSLQRHMKIHTQPGLYSCKHSGCRRNFTSQANLDLHMRVHNSDRPFVCTKEGCGKRFSSLGILQGHIRTHTGEKPFVCNFCGKKFSQTGHLGRHKLSHLRRESAL